MKLLVERRRIVRDWWTDVEVLRVAHALAAEDDATWMLLDFDERLRYRSLAEAALSYGGSA